MSIQCPVRRRHARSWAVLGAILVTSSAAPVQRAGAQPDEPPFEVVLSPALADEADARRTLPEDRPGNRAFVAPLFEPLARPWPFHPPPPSDARLHAAADLVARRLAFDGLPATAVRAIHLLRAEDPARQLPQADLSELLQAAGVPIDLLSHFRGTDNAPLHTAEFIRSIGDRLDRGESVEDIAVDVSRLAFTFSPTAPGFVACVESGDLDVGLVRLQLTRGNYWSMAGAGENLDVARQMLAAFPHARFIATIQHNHLSDLAAAARTWPIGRRERLTVIGEPWVVSQWTQDNGKAGTLPAVDDVPGDMTAESVRRQQGSATTPATLVPRFASRREDGSIFVPGESLLMDGLAAAGHRVVHSPLLFQGGNMLVVRDGRTGDRVMLVGEAEVYRNTALGLSHEQVLAAMAAEFGVDRCVVLPAVSFHVDYDVTVRTSGDTTMAFVNDARGAASVILRCGVDALLRGRTIAEDAARSARQALEANDPTEFLRHVGPVLGRHVLPGNRFPESFSRHFSVAPHDSGVGNLQCFLLALDTFVHEAIRPASAEAAAYLATFARRERDRMALNDLLRSLGWRVVPVPSLSDERRGINYLNGLHVRGRYLMPAWGGLYAPLDDAARRAFERELGAGVRVEPIHCAESQRRAGALHCSVAVYPEPAGRRE